MRRAFMHVCIYSNPAARECERPNRLFYFLWMQTKNTVIVTT